MERRTLVQAAGIFVATLAAGMPFALQVGQWLAGWPDADRATAPTPARTQLGVPAAEEESVAERPSGRAPEHGARSGPLPSETPRPAQSPRSAPTPTPATSAAADSPAVPTAPAADVTQPPGNPPEHTPSHRPADPPGSLLDLLGVDARDWL